MAEKNPEAVLREQEAQLRKKLEESVLGPPRSEEYSQDTYPLDFDPNQVSIGSTTSYEEIFPHAGNLRTDLELDNFSDVVNLLSANPRSKDEGHINRAAFLYAIDKNPPAEMILGLEESTYDTLLSEFEEAGMVYLDSGEPNVTSTGREVMNAMSSTVQEFNDYMEASKIFARVGGETKNCSDRLLTFLHSMETEGSLTDIAENLDVGRRAAAIRYSKLRDNHGLFIGTPDERRRTPKGEKAYQTVSTMAHYLDRISDQNYVSTSSEF